jgi:surface antigen
MLELDAFHEIMKNRVKIARLAATEVNMSNNGLLRNCLRAICLACLSAPLYAANVWFAKDMPISQMTDADIAIMSAAIEQTLDDADDGATQHWRNPETDAGGALTPLSTSEDGGMLCRQLEIANQAKGKSARSVFDYCRQADGSWKLRSGPSAADSKTQ